MNPFEKLFQEFAFMHNRAQLERPIKRVQKEFHAILPNIADRAKLKYHEEVISAAGREKG